MGKNVVREGVDVMKKICEYCGKEFNGKKNQICCSRKCSNELKYPKIKVKCDCCGKEIYIKKYDLERSKHHYCSRECKYKHQTDLFKCENNPNYKNAINIVLCSNCGEKIEIYNSNMNNSDGATKKNFYCSQECKAEHQKHILKGENNPNYGNGDKIKGDKNPAWREDKTDEEREKGRYISGYKEFKKYVFEYFNYTCQITGQRGGNLVVHHLNGYNWDKEHRMDINNVIVITEELHKEFHLIYGFGDNTREQFEQFINNKKVS